MGRGIDLNCTYGLVKMYGHRYFHPFISDKELIRTEGLIDFLVQYAVVAVINSDRIYYNKKVFSLL
jgi:hypothetical protein